MKINPNDFRLAEGDKVNLRKWPTLIKPVYKSREGTRNFWSTTSNN
jgi:hypothetical protein